MCKIIFLLIAFLSESFASDASLNIYAVYDPSKVGEVAMITAVVNEIALTHPTAQITKKPNATFHDLNLIDPSVIITAGQFGGNNVIANTVNNSDIPGSDAQFCSIDNPDCESCQ